MELFHPRTRGRYEGLILRLLRDRGPLSRTELAEITHLSPTTITKTVSPLLDHAYLEELGSDGENRIGRPAISVRLIPESITVCGIQISFGLVSIGLADANARVYFSDEFEFDISATPAHVLELIADRTAAIVRDHARSETVGIGVGVPGAVDRQLRNNVLSVNLGWEDVPIADTLERRLGIPTVVDHNARAMALAEANYGQYPATSLVFVYLKKGVGLGLNFTGESFYGGTHGISELGHIQVDENGALCPCGARGCLETVVSEGYLQQRLRAITGEESTLKNGVLDSIHRLANSGNDDALTLQTAFVEHLATGLASVVNLMNPELIIVGGILADAPRQVIELLHSRTRAKVYPLLRPDLRIELASSTLNSGLSGAAAVALQHQVYAYSAPTTFPAS